jgi:UPF0755 protein
MSKSWRDYFRPVAEPARFGILLLFVCSLYIGATYYVTLQFAPVSLNHRCDKVAIVTVKPGTAVSDVAATLHRQGLIRNESFFKFYAGQMGKGQQIKAGTYRISNTWPMTKILDCLITGKVDYTKVTIPEGFTVKQIKNLLAAKNLVTAETFQAKVNNDNFNESFLGGIPDGPNRLEGFLFPATYQIPDGMNEDQIIKVMLRRFGQVYTPSLQEKAQSMGLTTREVVTLASIVEREAKIDSERSVIAAVFENRLSKGIRLESCATVEYLLGKQKAVLSYADLKIESPYNTYQHEGLPPGPIANPGLAAIKAVLYPAKVNYLYFVARGDGSHYFSTTLAEHEAAAKRFGLR